MNVRFVSLPLALAALLSLLTPRASASLHLFCAEQGGEFVIARLDGSSLGDSVPLAECESAVRVSRQGVVCTKSGTDWSATLVATGKRLGRGLSFADCQASVEAARFKLVCTATESGARPWRPTHTVTANAFGRFGTNLADCLELTRNAGPGVVCTNTGTYSFQGRKPTVVDDKAYSDANLLGASGQQAYCTKATRESRNGFVCACNGDFCAAGSWILYDVARRKAVGATSDLEACIAAQGKR